MATTRDRITVTPVPGALGAEIGGVDLRQRLAAPADNLDQDLYVSEDLPNTGRVMVKDEDLCLHCGLCAERCPTAAWDMALSEIFLPHADDEAAERARRRAAE